MELLWLRHERRLVSKKLAVCFACFLAHIIATIYGAYSTIGDQAVTYRRIDVTFHLDVALLSLCIAPDASVMSRYEGQETYIKNLFVLGSRFPRGRRFDRHDLIRIGAPQRLVTCIYTSNKIRPVC